jgi:DNA-directed RNA polymerase specialized sigma24 family protein
MRSMHTDTSQRWGDDEDPADLVRAAQRGDTRAMSELLDLLAPYVGRLCGPIALQDGPDAAQEALTTVFLELRRLRDPAFLGGLRLPGVRVLHPLLERVARPLIGGALRRLELDVRRHLQP